MTTLVLNRSLLRIQEASFLRATELHSLSMHRLRPGATRRDNSSSFHFDGDVYLSGNTASNAGHGVTVDVDVDAFGDEGRAEWELTLKRKHEQMMMWNDQIQMHSKIMSGDVEAPRSAWW